MAFVVDVEAVKDYQDLLYPEGKYLVEVMKAKEGLTQKGREKIDLTLKILDTIPANEPIDTDNYLDPMDQVIFSTIYLPNENDPKRSADFMNKLLRDYLKAFDVQPENPGQLSSGDFEGTTGGILIKHEKAYKDDPDSELRAIIKKAVMV